MPTVGSTSNPTDLSRRRAELGARRLVEARERWLREGPDHYRMTVRLVGVDLTGDVLVEVGPDRVSGRCAPSTDGPCRLPEGTGWRVEELFALAATGTQPGALVSGAIGEGIDWSRIAPLDPCLSVSFDERYGYPRSIWHNCRDASDSDAWGIGIVEFEVGP